MVTTVHVRGDSHHAASHEWPSLCRLEQTGNMMCCTSENSISVWKEKECEDMFAGLCLSVNCATFRLCICFWTSALAWDVKAKKRAICLQR